MTVWDLPVGGMVETAGFTAATSRSIVLTSGAANAKGTWAELKAATSRDSCAVHVRVQNAQNTGLAGHLIDIGIGAAASEQVVVSNLLVATANDPFSGETDYFFPLFVPAGTRLSARNQSAGASNTCDVQIVLWQPAYSSQASYVVTTYGADLVNSRGTSVDPGASVNTKGAWSELSASTTRPIRALQLGFGDGNDATINAAFLLIDIGVGAAGSEQVIVGNLAVCATSTNDAVRPRSLRVPVPVSIPAGVRLAARCQSSTSAAGARAVDVIAYGIS